MLGREHTGVKRKSGLIRTPPHVIRTLIFPILQVVACTSLRILDNGLRHSPGLPRRSSEHLLVIRMHSLRLREHYQVPGKHSDRGVEVLLKHGSLPLREADGPLLEANGPPKAGAGLPQPSGPPRAVRECSRPAAECSVSASECSVSSPECFRNARCARAWFFDRRCTPPRCRPAESRRAAARGRGPALGKQAPATRQNCFWFPLPSQ